MITKQDQDLLNQLGDYEPSLLTPQGKAVKLGEAVHEATKTGIIECYYDVVAHGGTVGWRSISQPLSFPNNLTISAVVWEFTRPFIGTLSNNISVKLTLSKADGTNRSQIASLTEAQVLSISSTNKAFASTGLTGETLAIEGDGRTIGIDLVAGTPSFSYLDGAVKLYLVYTQFKQQAR